MTSRKLKAMTTRASVLRFATSLLFAASSVTCAGQPGAAAEEAVKRLPVGATLVKMRVSAPNGVTTSEPAVATGALTAAGSRDIAFAYERMGALYLRVAKLDSATAPGVDVPLPGSFVIPVVPGSTDAVVLRDPTGDGIQQVLIGTSNGASAGSYLNIWSFEGGSARELTLGTLGASGFDLDCERQGACRILAYGRWVNVETSTVGVYEWLGRSWFQTDSHKDEYVLRKISQVAGWATSTNRASVPSRVSYMEQAVEMYWKSRDYKAAVETCQAVLHRLDDPAMSEPRRIVGGEELIASDLAAGRARVHFLLGQSYEAMGLSSDAQAEYGIARSLGAVTGK